MATELLESDFDPNTKLRLLEPTYNRELGEEFIAHMEPELRAGSLVYHDPSEAWLYIGISIFSGLFFFICFQVYEFLWQKYPIKHYESRDRAGRIRFSGFCVANTHHIIVSLYFLWCFAVLCDENSQYPVGVKGRFLWFSNDQCLIQVSSYPAYGICYSIGYLLYDCYYNHWTIIDPEPLQG